MLIITLVIRPIYPSRRFFMSNSSAKLHPAIFILETVTGSNPQLSAFATNVLNCIADTIYSSEVIPTAYAIDFAAKKDHNAYRGIIDIDNYTAKISDIYGVKTDDIFSTESVRQAIANELSEMINEMAAAKNVPIERAAMNMPMFTRFHYLSKVYEQIHQKRPDDLSAETLSFVKKQLNAMILDDHDALGIDDILNMVVSDNLSNAAVWRFTTGVISSRLVEDGEGGSVLSHVSQQIGSLYSSDSFSAIFDHTDWTNRCTAISRACSYMDENAAVKHVLDMTTGLLSGILDERFRITIMEKLVQSMRETISNSKFNRYAMAVNATKDRTPAERDSDYYANMLSSSVFETKVGEEQLLMMWEGMPFNPMSKFLNVLFGYLMTNVRLYPELRLISGFSVDVDEEGYIDLKVVSNGLCTVYEVHPLAAFTGENLNISKHDWQHLFQFIITLLAGNGFKQIKDETLAKILAVLPEKNSDKYGKVKFADLITAVCDEFNSTIKQLSYNGQTVVFEQRSVD